MKKQLVVKGGMLESQSSNWKRWQVDLLLILVTLIWGGTFLVVQNSIKLTGPFSFLALRFTIGAVALGIIFRTRLLKITKWEIISGTIIGVLLFIGYALQTVGLQYTTTSKAGFITGMSVVIVPLLSVILLRQIPTLFATFGVIMAAIGLTLLSLGNGLSLDFGLGEMLLLGCAFSFALQILAVSRYAPGKDAFNLAIVQVAVTAILSAISAPLFGEPLVMPSGEVWGAALFMGVVATGFTFAVMNRVQQFTSSTRAVLIYSLEPVFAGIFGYLAGETLSIPAWIGCALIFAGMISSELKFKRRKAEVVRLPEPESEELAIA